MPDHLRQRILRYSAKLSLWVTNVKALQLFQILRQGGVILIAILLAQSSASNVAIGYYEMLLYIGYLLTFAWVSGFIQGFLSFYPTLLPDQQKQLLTQIWSLFAAFGLCVGILLWSFPETIAGALTQNKQLPHIQLFALFLLLNLPSLLQEYFYLLEDRPMSILHYGWISTSLQILAISLPVLLGYGFYVSFCLLTIVGGLKWLWTFFYVLQKGKWSYDFSLAQRLSKLSWPLILYTLLGAVNLAFDPWFVAYFYHGEGEEFAIYRYGAREIPFVMAVAGALSSAMIPLIAANSENGILAIREKSRKLFHLVFPISILLLLTSQWWFVWIFEEQFAASVPLFNTLLLLTASHLIFSRTILVALKDTSVLIFFVIIGITLNIGFTVFLTPYFGLLGIVFGTLIGFFIDKIMLVIYVQKKYKIKLSQYCDLKWWSIYTIILFVSWGISFL